MINVTILDISLRRMPFANFAGGQIYEVSLDDGEDNVFPKGWWLHFSLHHVSCLCGSGHHLHPGHPGERRHKIFGRGGGQGGEEEDQWQSLCSTLEVGLKKTFRFRTIKSEVQPQYKLGEVLLSRFIDSTNKLLLESFKYVCR